MKSFVLMSAALAAMAYANVATAQQIGSQQELNTSHQVTLDQHRKPLWEYSASSVAAADYRILDSLVNAFSYYTYNAQPYYFDPVTNILATIKRGNGSNSTQSLDNIFIRMSEDIGQSWSNPIGPLHSPTGIGMAAARYPSLLVNPLNSSNPEELTFFFSAPILTGSAGTFGGMVDGWVLADGTPLFPVASNLGVGAATWGSDSKLVATVDKSKVLTMSQLSDNSIGLRTFDLNSGAKDAVVPPQWASSNYSDPGTPTSRTSVNVGLQRDSQGKLYGAIFSRFPGPDGEAGRITPLPAVSTSSDNGASWSELNIMPKSVLRDYATSIGINPDSVLLPYNYPEDFIVTGPDKFVWAINLFEIDASKSSTETITQIVEAYYDNGQWGMRKIADWSGRTFLLINGTEAGDTTNQVQNEVQISPTADGSKLLVKWVDLVSFTFQADIDDDGVSPDTLITSDVFTSIRDMNGSTWTPPLNVTESPVLDREAWIPQVVPNDLTQLPLLTVQAIPNSQDVTIKDQLFNAQRQMVDRQQWVTISNVNAAATLSTPIDHTTETGLTAQISPNPTLGDATLLISNDKPGLVTVDVYTPIGAQVMSMRTSTVEAGNHVITLRTANLAAGVYYARINANGRSTTTTFTVVH